MTFREALTIAFSERPCQVAPTALWKVLRDEEGSDTRFEARGYNVSHLEMWQGRRLLQHWDKDRTDPHLTRQVERVQSALIHNDYVGLFPPAQFGERKSYFHLSYRGGQRVPAPRLPDSFSFEQVDLRHEAPFVSDIIGRCYDDIHPSEEAVRGWADHPVYDPRLWVWVVSGRENRPVALGIAEHDRTPQHGSIDWVQVLPEYRRQGLGKAVVLELLSRMNRQVRFTTVAGERDSAAQPEAFYRQCGFQGEDVWWSLRATAGESRAERRARLHTPPMRREQETRAEDVEARRRRAAEPEPEPRTSTRPERRTT